MGKQDNDLDDLWTPPTFVENLVAAFIYGLMGLGMGGIALVFMLGVLTGDCQI
jgi:hypothetical protein